MQLTTYCGETKNSISLLTYLRIRISGDCFVLVLVLTRTTGPGLHVSRPLWHDQAWGVWRENMAIYTLPEFFTLKN